MPTVTTTVEIVADDSEQHAEVVALFAAVAEEGDTVTHDAPTLTSTLVRVQNELPE